MVSAGNDSSYWMVGSDGGVYGLPMSGGPPFYGSLPPTGHYFSYNAIAATSSGTNGYSTGYYLMAFDGSILTYGQAQFQGDIYGNTTYGQIVGVAYT
jgi:hypothetical protein